MEKSNTVDPTRTSPNPQNPKSRVVSKTSKETMRLDSPTHEHPEKQQDSGKGAAESETQVDSDTEEYITGLKLTLVLGALTLVTFILMLDMSIITTALPEITTAFNSLADVGWYGAAYNLCGAALQPSAGKLYTHLRSKWTFLCFLFLFEIGSLICGVAVSSDMLIVGRAVAGMGSAGLFNGALTIIGATVPLQRRPVVIGIMIGFANVGLAAGPLIGGALTQYTTWRWCFYINLPIGGVVALLLAATPIPDKVASPLPLSSLPRHLDLPGFVLFAPAAVMFLLALQFGGGAVHPWISPVVIGLFVGAGVAALLFLYWERRQGDDEAMIPLGMFRSRIVWSSAAVGALNMAVTFVSSYYLPMYFQSVKGETPFRGGVDFLPTILSQLVFAVVGGALVGKMGYYLPWVVFGSIASTVGNGLISTWTPYTGSDKWIGYQILLGAGRGASMQMHIIAVQAHLPPSQLSVSMATVIFLQTFSGALFITCAQVIFSEGLGRSLAKYAPAVDARTVLAAGGTGFRTVVEEDDLPGVLVAYAKSINEVFYLLAGLGVLMFGLSWGMGWVDIRNKKTKTNGEV
ncbi:putative HC-toxin efflux carrier TOXA 25 [Colletotrichum chlorophyti]|uniref:Putative HC-toxin efflux carrier TOXA 25 n=1 Tax=Colletotrichum chlorophyti TaxID=708187 RepID=A0A1Q8R9G1_9PEZI|nr:putative HC-toxin efflux carrier TOXA 25 [Colletotrichum chlorophyti]